MFLSLTAQTFCKTLLLKHEQRTLVIMAKINDTFATIYLSSPKVIDVINQSQKCYTLKKLCHHLNWVFAPHIQQRFEVQEVSNNNEQDSERINTVPIYTMSGHNTYIHRNT